MKLIEIKATKLGTKAEVLSLAEELVYSLNRKAEGIPDEIENCVDEDGDVPNWRTDEVRRYRNRLEAIDKLIEHLEKLA